MPPDWANEISSVSVAYLGGSRLVPGAISSDMVAFLLNYLSRGPAFPGYRSLYRYARRVESR